MNTRTSSLQRPVLRLFLFVAVLAAASCDSKAPPSASGGGGGLSGLADSPTSIPGKSAADARKLVGTIGNSQDEASNLANDISGQGNTLTAGGISFTIPERWEKLTTTDKMQTALYRLAADEGGGETTVALFGNLMGNVQSNIERWRGQVTKDDGQKAEPRVTTAVVQGFTVTMVSLDGSYAGMKGGSMSDAGFRGVLIEVGGQKMVCLRLTGPRATVESKTDEFFAFAKSFKK